MAQLEGITALAIIGTVLVFLFLFLLQGLLSLLSKVIITRNYKTKESPPAVSIQAESSLTNTSAENFEELLELKREDANDSDPIEEAQAYDQFFQKSGLDNAPNENRRITNKSTCCRSRVQGIPVIKTTSVDATIAAISAAISAYRQTHRPNNQ